MRSLNGGRRCSTPAATSTALHSTHACKSARALHFIIIVYYLFFNYGAYVKKQYFFAVSGAVFPLCTGRRGLVS